MSKRVAITGSGVVSALGNQSEELHRALCDGACGVRPIQLFECKQSGGEIPEFDARAFLGEGNLRPLDRIAQLAASAAQLALTNSVCTPDMREKLDVGIVLGTVFSSAHTISVFDQVALRRGPRFVKPLDFANTVINAATGQTAIWHNLRGVNSTVATGGSSGLQAIGYASDLIRTSRSDALLAGGAEELSFEMLFGFERLGMLGGNVDTAVPFDKSRTGLMMGEGAAFLMLEDCESAKAREASILGEIRGYGTSFDPERGQYAPQLCVAMVVAIRAALQQAEIGIDDIHCISSSASGGLVGDRCEAEAIAEVFGARKDKLPITAIKSAVGDTLGASGAIQTVALLEHMIQGELPGVRGFNVLGDDIDLPTVSNENQSVEMQNGLVLSFGIDGNLCALVVSKTLT